MIRFNQRIDIQHDVSAAGDEAPSYATKVRYVPAAIQQISGDETYRGRQLEGHIDYVVTIRRQVVDETNRIKVATGLLADRILNVEWARELMQANGKPPLIELYCRELSG